MRYKTYFAKSLLKPENLPSGFLHYEEVLSSEQYEFAKFGIQLKGYGYVEIKIRYILLNKIIYRSTKKSIYAIS